MKRTEISFKKFVTLFPEVELPITLTTDTHHEFSLHNKAIPQAMIDEFLATAHDDDFTEYIPCFSIPNTKSFVALVYWKAGLLEYEYSIATFDKEGNLLDKRSISGTKVNKDVLTRSVATIESDWLINVVEGAEVIRDKETIFNPQQSRVHSFEMTASGEIVVAEE